MFLWDKSYNLKGFWYYILGSFILILFSTIGQIPLLFFLDYDSVTVDTTSVDLLNTIPSNLRLFLIMISFVLVLPGIWLVVKKLHDLPLMSILSGRKNIDYNRILFSFSLWGSVILFMVITGYLISPENYEINFKLKEFLILLIIAVCLIPIQTSVEEIVFRGYLMQGFGHWFNSRFMALFMSCVVFGLLHIVNPEVIQLGYGFLFVYLIGSFTLGTTVLMDDGLELALGFHAANNLFIALLLTSDWTALQTESVLKDISDPKFGIYEMLTGAILYPMILYIFAKKYSWTNWKGKLFSKVR